jgi:hypothetical protein
MKRTLILFLLLLFVGSVYAQRPADFKGCKPEGNGKPNQAHPNGTKLSPDKEALNLLKNRDTEPTSIDDSVTLEAIMKPANDGTFQPSQGVGIIGYVANVKAGEPQETCNCARTDIADIHIDFVLQPADAATSSKFMIIEITPRFQDALGNLAAMKTAIQGKWVRFTGWMLYDVVHKSNAKNTNPTGRAIWRATAWEVHPVTKVEVCTTTIAQCKQGTGWKNVP